MKRGRPKAKNPETARRILAAAEQIFAQRGLAGARTDEIAAAAHANKAMLYYYYGDKQRLYHAVIENLFSQLRNSILVSRPANGSPRGQLLAYVNGYFDFVSTHPNYPRIVQREVMQSGPQLQWIVQKYFRPFHRRLSRAIEEGIAAGEIQPVDPNNTVFSIIAITVFYFAAAPVVSRVLGRDALRPQAVAARKRAVLDFLERALFRPQARAK
jgi:TetR/AcrR family transcriptional regulator